MNLTPDKIPDSLRQRKAWIVWKEVVRDGEKTKLPFQVTGEAAKSNDPSTWSTFKAARARYERGGYNGPGFMFEEGDPFCGIDLDGCRNPETGAVAEWAREIVTRFNSYTEVSPSGSGVKIFIRGRAPFGRKRKINPDVAKVSPKTPGIEVYDNRRYFAVTGWRLSGISPAVEPRDEAMKWLGEKYLPLEVAAQQQPQSWYTPESVIERARKYLSTMPGAVSGQHGHDATFRTACILVQGFGLTIDQALPLLTEWGEKCQPPWKEKDLRHKLEDANRKPGERNYLRNAKPEDWSSISVPRYEVPPQRSEPTITTMEGAARKYLDALKSGKSSLIDLGLPDVDYAIGGGVEPGEMVILAARPSHGKSAVALQCIHYATAQGKGAVFISEEMSELAVGKRVLQFASDVPIEHWPTSVETVSRDIDQHFKSRAECEIVESCGTVQRATDAIRRAVETKGIKIAIVDYAQLLGAGGKSRYEQITNTSIALRQLASQTKIVLLVLCQLNRSIEARNKFVPQMSDLKDTGQLEQDADVILFLVWPHRIDQKQPPNEYQFFVGKNRNRPINQVAVKCRFHPSRQMFMPEKPAPRYASDAVDVRAAAAGGSEWSGEPGDYDAFRDPT